MKKARTSKTVVHAPCIAGIGASAGGLEAIHSFFQAMPATSGIAFVVIQHLYPTQKSLAAEIIGKYTAMPVVAAEAGMRLLADHVYTIPANTYPALAHGVLEFAAPPEHQGLRLPIDHFFASLGTDQHERAIGIILSGSGSDGASGLKSIVANGGIVLAQDPATAQFDGMPESAIGTGLVKHVMAVDQMPAILLGYASLPHADDFAATESTLVLQLEQELEATKEDLQSLNEELSSVNAQLENKVNELEASNGDLKNLLASSEIATICLTRDFRIKWFTPATQGLCNILMGDIGRPISDFSAKNTGPDLLGDAALILEDQSPRQREMRLKGERWYIRHMLPYRAEDGRIEGVIVTYGDISETKRAAEESTAALRRMAESLEEQVRTRTAQLSKLSTELTLTEDRERRALAQDLHDDLGQVLAIVKIKLTALYTDQDLGKFMGPLKEIETLVDQANKSMRSLALQLSPPVLYTLGLVPALNWLAEEIERVHGLIVNVHDDDQPKPLDERRRITLFRAVRELLVNVAKHAHATRAIVTSLRKDGQLILAVSDSGCGFDYLKTLSLTPGSGGLGLIGVQERLSLIGGAMHVDSSPDDGTTITLSTPLATDPKEAV